MQGQVIWAQGAEKSNYLRFGSQPGQALSDHGGGGGVLNSLSQQ